MIVVPRQIVATRSIPPGPVRAAGSQRGRSSRSNHGKSCIVAVVAKVKAGSSCCKYCMRTASISSQQWCVRHVWYFSSRFEAEMLTSWMMNSLLLSRSQSPTPRGSARAWAQGRHQHWRPNRRLPVQLVQWPFVAFWQCTLLEHFACLSAAVAARYECNHHDKAEHKDQHLG